VIVGYGVLDLHLPHARDLKAKRRVVRGLIDRLHARWRISVAETGAQELWQRAEVSVAVVGRDAGEVERILAAVEAAAEDLPEALVLDWRPGIVEDVE
jgi:uncharacterized protein YlxP (DUF503 family)